MHTTPEKIKEQLENNGIRPSHHRIEILKYLMEHKTHPTADIIHKDLVKRIPTLSKTTVYNTLNTFTEKNIVTALTIEENELRYDYDTSPHIHFKCEKCGNVYDIEPSENFCNKEEIDGHKILSFHIYYKGICKNCR